jgi:hypothetical protein
MADGAMVVCCVVLTPAIAEKREAAGSAVYRRSSGKFVLCGRAEIVGTQDDHA